MGPGFLTSDLFFHFAYRVAFLFDTSLIFIFYTSYPERGPLMWIMPLHLHVNQKSDYDDDDDHLSQQMSD